LTTAVLLLVLFAAFLHAAWNAVVKAEPDKLAMSWAMAASAGVVAAALTAFVPLPLPPAWPLIALSAGIHVAYFALVGLALRHADLSAAYPITRGAAPPVTAILAFVLLGETMALNGWLAVGAIAAGIATLSADALVRGGLSRGAALLAIGNAAIVVLYTLIDGMGARLAGNAISYVAWMTAATGLLVLLLALAVWPGGIFGRGMRFWSRAFAGGSLSIASYGIALWAMTQAPIGLVAAVRETSVLFAGALGVFCFGERFGAARWGALALIVVGIVLLRLPL
jgi:drug/metabolite transporter (DMT)-like permease